MTDELAQYDVSVVGEINSDLILYGLPRELPEETEILASGFTFTLGSSSAILAHNLALLGNRVAFSAKVGDDVLGQMCCQRLQEAGIDLSRVVQSTSGSQTGVTLILPLVSTRRILTYPGTMSELGIEDLDLDFLATAKHFHLSSPFLQSKLLPDLPVLFQEMRQRGLTASLDTNDDPAGKWAGILEEVLPHVDLLFCTEDELRKLAKTDDAEQRVASCVRILVVKRGSRGASVYAEGRRIDGPALSLQVIDAVGAGDTFNAGFLHQWIRQAPLESCLACGNLAGGLSVTRSGGIEAFRDEDHRRKFFNQHWQHNRLVL
ncbi:MAG TPA: carbohydrate kinase family protein [Terracidiphilus sp.]|nr:carbohydrate kinase family protein [Terracidiphilus sp.]